MAEVVRNQQGNRTGYAFGETKLVEIIAENTIPATQVGWFARFLGAFQNSNLIVAFEADMVEKVRDGKSGYLTNTDFFKDGKLVATFSGDASYVVKDIQVP